MAMGRVFTQCRFLKKTNMASPRKKYSKGQPFYSRYRYPILKPPQHVPQVRGVLTTISEHFWSKILHKTSIFTREETKILTTGNSWHFWPILTKVLWPFWSIYGPFRPIFEHKITRNRVGMDFRDEYIRMHSLWFLGMFSTDFGRF